MKRAAIYARFSIDLQNERSVDDQFALCRAYAKREGLDVVETFDDKARSGASILNRDGLLELIERSKAGAFDVVVVEALDRLSRDMEDLAGLHKRLTFRGIEIRAVHEGVADTVTVGLRAIVGQLQREDGAKKVRRGMAGVIRSKRHAGGAAYGFAPVKGEPGRLVIVEERAEVVRRIFAEFVRGDTTRDIAKRLNRSGIPAPRGKTWNASTIIGHVQRGNGIIRNELYVGRLVWNKVRMVKDPDTGRRVSRPNPRDEWHTADVPALAIVPLDLFAAAAKRVEDRQGIAPVFQRKARHLLTGLLRCAACGSGMSTYGKKKGSPRRVRCTRHSESGTCPNPKTFYVDTIESAVVGALRAELRHPDLIAEFVRTYHEERKRLASRQGARRATIERRLGEVGREVERIIDGVAKGALDPAIFGPRASALDEERKALEAEARAEPERVVTLHPATLERYADKIGQLQAAMAAGTAAGNAEYSEAIRDLVEAVVVSPGDAPGRVTVEISGRLAALLGPEAFPHGRRGVAGSLVAGSRFRPSRHQLTYRLVAVG